MLCAKAAVCADTSRGLQFLSVSSHIFCLFVCFVALRPKSTAMVIAGRSVHLTTRFS